MMLPEHMRFCLTGPLPTSVWVGDELIVHTNDAFAAFLGAEQHAAVLGRPAREGFGALWAVLEPLVERAPTVATDVRLVLARRGAPQEVFATIAVSSSESGVVCTFIDTTEHVLAARRLAAQDHLISVVTHDARSWLGAARSMLDVMRMSGSAAYANELATPLRHTTQLLDGLLDHSRISRGKLALHRERVEVAQILARAVELAGAATARIDTVDGVTVVADGERLASALAHLLVHGEQCELTGEIVGDRLRIHVQDGSWNAADLAPWLARNASPATGTALALAFARAIVELHGGVIVAHGDAVVIEVPVDAEVIAAPPREPVVRTKGRKRVLLVEDNDDAARSLKSALELLGYEVAVAHDGPVALTVARAFRPDVALLDIGLPVMDGYELANRLRSINVATRELHVVAVTAYGTDEFRRRSQDAGFAEHLVKPVDLARLERVVEALD